VSDRPPVPYPVHHLTAAVCAPAVALSGSDGQLRPGAMHGLYVGEWRMLSEAVLRVGELDPYPLVAIAEGAGRIRFISVIREVGDVHSDPTVRVERVRTMRRDGMDEEVWIGSDAAGPVVARVSLGVASDLSPLEAVKLTDGPRLTPRADPSGLVWTREGVRVTVDGDGATVTADGLSWQVELAPGAHVTLRWRARASQARPVVIGPTQPVEWSRPTVTAGDRRLGRLVARALDDLEALRLTEPDGPGDTFLGAGVPWFLTLFGRDSIWAARMMLPLGTELAAGTLRALARRQGVRVDPRSGEAPGKIMHELRGADVRLPDVLDSPAVYYGTIDATPLWISLLHDAWRWGMPAARVRELLPALEGALGWLAHHSDPDGDGFLEYRDLHGMGLANQGWKDSGDAIRFRDGTLAVPPIALCEVQGYAYRAALDAAALMDAFGVTGAKTWREYAARLADRFRDAFWVDGRHGRQPALALDRDKRPVDSLTSNIGHLLGTGLLSVEESAQVVSLLALPELADGHGLRTMSAADAGFRPLSYHRGGIWPHDTALAVLGLSRVGAHEPAAALMDGLLAAAECFDFRLPEMYGGDPRHVVPRPVPHPTACRPQAWAAAAALVLVQAALGLRADVPGGEIHLAPLAGSPLGTLSVSGLRVGGHPFSVEVARDGRPTVTGLPPGLRLAGQGAAPVVRQREPAEAVPESWSA
jgi:glycogen debranching enzyme